MAGKTGTTETDFNQIYLVTNGLLNTPDEIYQPVARAFKNSETHYLTWFDRYWLKQRLPDVQE